MYSDKIDLSNYDFMYFNKFIRIRTSSSVKIKCRKKSDGTNLPQS